MDSPCICSNDTAFTAVPEDAIHLRWTTPDLEANGAAR
jgi:hypothetical protein